jgi:hypothetical protein
LTKMSEHLLGLRVQVVVQEDGSSNPPRLPPGTLTRIMIGSDRETYYLVRLDTPVRCKHVRTGENWILQNLAIAPNFIGGTLDPLLSSKPTRIPVGIVNLFYVPNNDDPVLDFSKGEHFATGIAERI